MHDKMVYYESFEYKTRSAAALGDLRRRNGDSYGAIEALGRVRHMTPSRVPPMVRHKAALDEAAEVRMQLCPSDMIKMVSVGCSGRNSLPSE